MERGSANFADVNGLFTPRDTVTECQCVEPGPQKGGAGVFALRPQDLKKNGREGLGTFPVCS
jgi:hypothetical protein